MDREQLTGNHLPPLPDYGRGRGVRDLADMMLRGFVDPALNAIDDIPAFRGQDLNFQNQNTIDWSRAAQLGLEEPPSLPHPGSSYQLYTTEIFDPSSARELPYLYPCGCNCEYCTEKRAAINNYRQSVKRLLQQSSFPRQNDIDVGVVGSQQGEFTMRRRKTKRVRFRKHRASCDVSSRCGLWTKSGTSDTVGTNQQESTKESQRTISYPYYNSTLVS